MTAGLIPRHIVIPVFPFADRPISDKSIKTTIPYVRPFAVRVSALLQLSLG